MNTGLMHIVGMSTLAAGSGDGPMSGAQLLGMMILLPLLTALGIAIFPTFNHGAEAGRANARNLALGTSLLVFLLSLFAACKFNWDDAGAMQFISSTSYIKMLGVSIGLGVDAVSLWLLLLTTFLMPVILLGTWGDGGKRSGEFYFWLLVLQSALVGVFCATDIILFYTFFELTLVPLFFLIGIFGGTQRHYASVKFFLFTLGGSVFTLAGLLYVAWFNARNTGVWTFDIAQLVEAGKAMNLTQQAWVLGALMAGFAVKVPLFPVHTWLPLAHTEAPTAGSAILAGVLLKLGSYGILRFALPMVPQAFVHYAPLIAIFCIIGVLYAALVCWVQSDIKKLVAYSSVSHMGFCILGLAALNTIGVGGSIIYMINHGLSTGALFLCVGMMYNRYHTREMDNLSGLGRRMPVWAFFMVFFSLASVGLPGLNGFIGEFLTIFGAFTSAKVLGPSYAAVAALGLILGAIYILYMLGRVVLGPLKEPAEAVGHVHDLNTREIAALAPIALACFVLGVYPTPLLKSLEPSIARLTAPAQAVIAASEQPQPIDVGVARAEVAR
jgi:NADH-quinone oxidoreductase subunit M